MPSVTYIANKTKQPRGGFIKAKQFTTTSYDDGMELFTEENIDARNIGLAVDCLTRLELGDEVEKVFEISLHGASRAKEKDVAEKLINQIDGLNGLSIKCACKLVPYDTYIRAGTPPYIIVQKMDPDDDTIFNIKTMVERNCTFFKTQGPVIKSGFTFSGGYTDIVESGDGDYMTEDTLWDLKVYRKPPTTKENTLQLLMYYLLGTHSDYLEYKSITKLGMFNPRSNTSYLLKIADIDAEVLNLVSKEIIGYK